MKNLLHSKGFRRNLIQWLFMYCGVMCIFTIVVTYSRYIAKISVGDNAVVANFNVDVQPIRCTSPEASQDKDNETCFDSETSSKRPTDKVSFYYSVDTTELEVATKIVTTITINNRKISDTSDDYYFSNFELYEIKEDNSTEKIPTSKYSEHTENGITTITINNEISSDAGNIRKYKLLMHYNYKEVGYNREIILGDSDKEFISVHYSATQID